MSGMKLSVVAIVTLLAVAGCVPGPRAQTAAAAASRIVASGPIATASGGAVGVARIIQAADGSLSLGLELARYPAGVYGIHVHAVGRCDAPDFASAGAHWNPGMRQHGRTNPLGTHNGDLPNVTVGRNGMVMQTYPLPGALTGSDGLLDADGAAFIIHASPDDNRTDPSGNSGARIACAVLAPTD